MGENVCKENASVIFLELDAVLAFCNLICTLIRSFALYFKFEQDFKIQNSFTLIWQIRHT
jgi:hypothetical protein